ncbi:hypothetical protein A9Q83_00820 [Alphaproteobacteria bacterium 46_93_T64]|nr:hypothetical protein A9Q83_00820 [Alphaproteobacteria bacterium 46_93_T64]
MKFLTALGLFVASCLLVTSVMAANTIPKDLRDDAEYMMRKVVEDIHARNLRAVVTDKTLDKSIQVVGRAKKFIAARRDVKTGELYACAVVSLKTKITASKTTRTSIKRTDEICTGSTSGTIKYVANIR